MKIEFSEYKATPGEKHLGIASVKLDDIILLRYKVHPGKDGKGYFFQSASHKMSETEYVPSFLLNSNFTIEAIMSALRNGIKPYIASANDPDYIPF